MAQLFEEIIKRKDFKNCIPKKINNEKKFNDFVQWCSNETKFNAFLRNLILSKKGLKTFKFELFCAITDVITRVHSISEHEREKMTKCIKHWEEKWKNKKWGGGTTVFWVLSDFKVGAHPSPGLYVHALALLSNDTL